MTVTQEKRKPGRPKKVDAFKLIDGKQLDLSFTAFRERIDATGISLHQISEISDISRARVRRVLNGETGSLVERTPGHFVVPRVMAIFLLALENGTFTATE